MTTRFRSTVLKEGEEWPREWALSPGSGLSELRDKPLLPMVAMARDEWIRTRGDLPSTLLVGAEKRSQFLRMLTAADFSPRLDDSYVFMGLRVEWCPGSGIALA